MNKLKRLIDMKGEIIDIFIDKISPKKGTTQSKNGHSVYVNVIDLRNEAIKWIKALEDDNNWKDMHGWTEFKPFRKEGYDLSIEDYAQDDREGAIKFIKFFFGITSDKR